MTSAAKSPYAGYRFPGEIISHAVWLYFRFPLYRPQLVRHLIACYAASTAGESWFCRTAAGVWNPCRSMSQVVL